MDLNTRHYLHEEANKSGLLSRIMKLLSKKEKSEILKIDNGQDAAELLESIQTAKNDWASANANFEYANDSQMVDYYTYNIKACEVRYEYLLRQAKEKGLRVDFKEVEKSQADAF